MKKGRFYFLNITIRILWSYCMRRGKDNDNKENHLFNMFLVLFENDNFPLEQIVRSFLDK